MTGKVLKESSNIYQDQARILFDYYKAAAEKIVSEETAAENKYKEIEQKIEGCSAQIKKNKIGLIVCIAAAGFVFLLTIILLIVKLIQGRGAGILALLLLLIAPGVIALVMFLKNKNLTADIAKYREEQQNVRNSYGTIRRDYAVNKIGVVYVPVATRVPFEDKSFLIDHTNSVENKDFHLTLLRQPDEFKDSIEQLKQSMDSMPIIETNENPETINTSDYSLSMQNITLHDYAGNIDRQVRNINYLLNDSEQVSVDIPAIVPASDEARFIEEYATTEVADKPVVQVFDVSFEDRLTSFTELNKAREQLKTESSDSEDFLKMLMGQLAESVSLMSKVKNAGASNLTNYTSRIFATVLKAGYTQYSPFLEAEEIDRIRGVNFDYKTEASEYEPFKLKKSSVVKYDLFSNNWVAEDGSRTTFPFGMHQVDEEVLMPVIQNLMQENRLERARIYNNIEDQKRMYLDRWASEIGNYFRDNRSTADDLINRMRETYADFTSSYSLYKSLEETAGLMKSSDDLANSEVNSQDMDAELIAGFETQARQYNQEMDEFTDYMDRIMEDINNMTDEFSHIEYYEGSLRDTLPHATAVAMANIHSLDQRQRQLLAVSPYLAKYGELPPAPQTSEELLEDVDIDLETQAQEKLRQLMDQERGQTPTEEWPGGNAAYTG